MAFSQCVGPQDIKGQCWTDEESDGENESEQFLYGIQVQQRLLQYTVYIHVYCAVSRGTEIFNIDASHCYHLFDYKIMPYHYLKTNKHCNNLKLVA